MEAGLLKGREPPDWYLDEPPAQPLDDFYFRSFRNLGTTRQFQYGPIPWNSIVNYGHHIGLYADIVDEFVVLIMAMDDEYLKWTSEEIERLRKQKTIEPTRKPGRQ